MDNKEVNLMWDTGTDLSDII